MTTEERVQKILSIEGLSVWHVPDNILRFQGNSDAIFQAVCELDGGYITRWAYVEGSGRYYPPLHVDDCAVVARFDQFCWHDQYESSSTHNTLTQLLSL